jgi:hypothetical protein
VFRSAKPRLQCAKKPRLVFIFEERAERAITSASSSVLIFRHSCVGPALSVCRKRRKRFGRRNSLLPAEPRSVTSTNPRATTSRIAGAMESRSMPYS